MALIRVKTSLFKKETYVFDDGLSDIEKLALHGTEIEPGVVIFTEPGQHEGFWEALFNLARRAKESRAYQTQSYTGKNGIGSEFNHSVSADYQGPVPENDGY